MRAWTAVGIAVVTLSLTACGGATVLKKPENTGALKRVSVGSVQVTSKEAGADAQKKNAAIKRHTAERIQAELKAARRLGEGQGSLSAAVEVAYGSAGARLLSAGLVGGGGAIIKLTLKDAAGKVRYQTSSEIDLTANIDAQWHIERAISTAVDDFVDGM